MKMKNRIISYMEDNHISTETLSEILDIDADKLKKDSKQVWTAEDLLEICAYLQIDPMGFYEKQL